MPISVDDAFLTEVAAKNLIIWTGAPDAAKGEIDEMIIKPGTSNFASGQRMAKLIRDNGAAVKTRLVTISTTAFERHRQLTLFVATTDNAEGANGMTAQEFASRVPTLNPNGSGGGTP